MSDLVAEAIAFFNETREEGEFDLQSPLVWGYVLGSLRPEQVEPLVAAIRQQGFGDVTQDVSLGGEPPRIRVSEQRIHTAESFAERVKILTELASQHGWELLDWSLDSGEETALTAITATSGCLTPQNRPVRLQVFRPLAACARGDIHCLWDPSGDICCFAPSRKFYIGGDWGGHAYASIGPGAQLIVGVLLWRASGAIGRRMFCNDPTPLRNIRLDITQLMMLACMATGIFVFSDEVRNLFSLASWLFNLPVDPTPGQLWSNAHWTQNFWPAIFGLALAAWLILGSRGIARWIERLRSGPGPLPDEDNPVQETPPETAN